MTRKSRIWTAVTAAAAVAAAAVIVGCSATDTKIDNVGSLMMGRAATVTTYNVHGQKLDTIHGKSIDIRRDETFDSTDAEGNSNKDSSVLKISVGKSTMTHVGSTLLMVEDGIVSVTDALPKTVTIENTDRGTPFVNFIKQRFHNLWKGKSRTILVRSQNGSPIGIFAGNTVEYYATSAPKSTMLKIDGKYLLIYRSDYTLYDTDLL